MKSLVSLIEAATKVGGKERPLGALEGWAREQIQASMKRAKVTKFDMVATIDSQDKDN